MNLALIGVFVLVAAAMFEVVFVQRKASPCDRVIREAESFESHAGRYPQVLEMQAMEPELSATCGFKRSQDSFALVVTGHGLSPQTYTYESGRQRWRWE